MRIPDNGRANELASALLGITETERVSARRQADSPAKGDQVEISEKAKELQRIKGLVEQPDPGRAERIEALRKAIEAGHYTVNADRVADKLIRNVLTDAVL
jgi:negative regulator of flagellin synthesis FlgM